MCKSQQTSNTGTTLPGYVTDLGAYVSQFGTGLGNNPPNAPLEQIASPTALQNQGFNVMGGYAPTNVLPQAIDWTTSAATAGPQSVGVPSVDPSTLNLQPYMTAASGPLQQTLDVINQQADANRKQLEAQATMEGGGTGGAGVADPQALIGQSLSDLAQERATSEAAGTAYGNAFNSALDTGFKNATQIQLPEQEANAAYNEQELQREMSGAGGILSDVTGGQNNLLSYVQSLLQTGGAQQALAQAPLSALFQQESTQYQQPFQIAQTLASLLGSQRGVSNTDTSVTQPNNSLMALLGSLGGSLLSSGSGAGGGLLSSLGSGLGSVFSGIGSGIGSVASGAGDMLGSIGSGIMDFLPALAF